MFVVRLLPALMLIPQVYRSVPESLVSNRARGAAVPIMSVLRWHWKLTRYTIVLMTALKPLGGFNRIFAVLAAKGGKPDDAAA
jgi:hypothetical protein